MADKMKKKRVLVVTSDVPFVRGGHRIIAENTRNALERHGYTAEIHYTPQNRFGRQISGYIANRLTDLNYSDDTDGVDRIITMRFPSYAVKHPENILWLVHRLREYYDLWDEYKKILPLKGKIKETMRKTIIRLFDSYFLTNNVKRIYTISAQVSERLKKWGGLDSTVLHPPVTPCNWHSENYGYYFLYVSRLKKHKRIDLFVKAAAHVKGKRMRFVIAGGGPEEKELKKLISRLRLTKRFEMTGPVNQDELIDLYSKARAVVFCPLREEYGFVTLESFRSEKPVITAGDSGGPTELVYNNKSGYIVPPKPEAIAEKMDQFTESEELAQKMGEYGNRSTQHINWENTIKELMKPI